MVSMLKEILSFITGEGLRSAKDAVRQTREEIERAAKESVKRAIIGVIMLIGFIFFLVGLSAYLDATVPSLGYGLGYMVVGGGMVLLGLIVKWLR
ncbi:MAG: hypothetical protein ABIH41_05910 [Nanoarchaeota archaeon]